jgi:hypothetical protein
VAKFLDEFVVLFYFRVKDSLAGTAEEKKTVYLVSLGGITLR